MFDGIKNFLIGDTSQQRDKVNSANWDMVNHARSNYEKAQAYQSALKNYFNENPNEDKSGYEDILSDDFLKGYSTDVENANKNYQDQYTKGRWNEFGSGGLVSGILNPMFQAASLPANALSSLNGGESDNWTLYGNQLNDGSYRNRRDLMSDVGAVGDTALTIATLGTGGAAKTLGKSLAKGALTGAGYGLFGTLNDKGSEATLGDLALSSGIGGVVGGGMSGLGYGVNKLATGAQNARNMANDYQNDMNQAGGQTTNLLGDGVGGASIKSNPNIDWLNSRGSLAKTKLGQAAQCLGDIASLAKANGVSPLSSISNSKLGKATSKILKTKKGKIGAGVGAGLVLNKVLNGKNNQELSDDELDELYNYYYGGQ